MIGPSVNNTSDLLMAAENREDVRDDKILGGYDWTRWHIMMRNDQQDGYIPRHNDALGYYRNPVDFVQDDGCGIYELKLYKSQGQEERDNGCIHIHITSIALY